jgi:hypothetical protein
MVVMTLFSKLPFVEFFSSETRDFSRSSSVSFAVEVKVRYIACIAVLFPGRPMQNSQRERCRLLGSG